MALHRINLNLPADLHSRFVATARREDRTLTVVLVRALEAYIVGSEGQPTGDKVIVQSVTWLFRARSRHPRTGPDSSLGGPCHRRGRTRLGRVPKAYTNEAPPQTDEPCYNRRRP